MKQIALLLCLIILLTSSVSAQSNNLTYKTALGVKVWDGGGISFKTFIIPANAIEAIGYFYRYGTRLTGLYEIHKPISGVAGLRWYVGPGVHIGFYDKSYYTGDKAIIGLDGVLGLDYKINNAPLNISLDWQPSFEFADNRGFAGGWGGLGVRYTF